MDDLSLAHSRYNCTYHIVFIPKYRRKVMFGNLRKEVGEILGRVCKMEEVRNRTWKTRTRGRASRPASAAPRQAPRRAPAPLG